MGHNFAIGEKVVHNTRYCGIIINNIKTLLKLHNQSNRGGNLMNID